MPIEGFSSAMPSTRSRSAVRLVGVAGLGQAAEVDERVARTRRRPR